MELYPISLTIKCHYMSAKKINIDSKTVDLSCYGGHAEIEILYAAFADAADANNVSIQVVRNPKINVAPSTSTMYKEISIKK